MQLYVCARALGLEPTALGFVVAVPWIFLASSIPAFWGGWGAREGAASVLFVGAGLGPEAAVATAIAFGLSSLCASALLFCGLFSARVVRATFAKGPSTVRHAVWMVAATAAAYSAREPAILAGVAAASFAVLVVRHRTSAAVPQPFGPANAVTTLRLLLVAMLAGAPVAHWALAVGACVAFALDGLDGWVARRFRAETDFGALYDMEVDAFLVLALTLRLASSGEVGSWVLVAGLWRYAYVLLLDAMPARFGEAPRSSLARWFFLGLVVCLTGALVAPPTAAVALAAVGTFIVSVSFGRSLYQSYFARAA
jgi:phosphatidylglycerophosphate synthase